MRAPAAAICAGMVKANAYGLGVARVAPALWQAGCHHFFTANIERRDAVMRTMLPQAHVHVLERADAGRDPATFCAGTT